MRVLKVVSGDPPESGEVKRGSVDGDLGARLGCAALDAVNGRSPVVVVGHAGVDSETRDSRGAELGRGGGDGLRVGEGGGESDEHAAGEEVEETHGVGSEDGD